MLVASCLLGVGCGNANAQLAITEVMSSASTNLGLLNTDGRTNGSDFVELTNFGSTNVDLEGYQIGDKVNLPRDLLQPGDPPLEIEPGESVVFVRQKQTTNEMQFRAWWGTCLPPSVRIRFYPSPGFSSVGDGVRLYDRNGFLVDQVDFPAAHPGVTFVYGANCGDFGVLSVPGVCGTCEAEMAGDIGSPGTTCGPVPLQIREQPASLLVCAGMTTTLQIKACGLPRPRYQWFDGDVAIPGATDASLTITNVTLADEGDYHVEVSNGVAALRSTNATLTVSTDPSPPTIAVPPADFELYEGQTARFSVTVCAFPPPSFQWLSDGVPIAGATGPILRISNCNLAMSDTLYCVQITNSLGSTSACARLTVTTKPQVRITEILASALPDCPTHHDWFELSNEGTNVVNLLGWRFSDAYKLEGALTNIQPVLLSPGQSVIFAERLSAEEFRRWWGTDNLPPSLQIITYAGFGFNADLGDDLYLWNNAAKEVGDAIDSRSFSSSLPGLSWYFMSDEADACFSGCLSVDGELGAFRAAECGDIGSPGYRSSPAPRLLSITLEEGWATLRWHGVPRKTYQLRYKTNLTDLTWSLPVTTCVATNSIVVATDPTAGDEPQRIYRVEELP